MTVRIIPALFIICWQSLAGPFSAQDLMAKPSAPNVILIVADDLGWNAVGYHNPEFKTPNIDRLVTEGCELDRFYVAPMCSPTRAGIMTGRYPIRFGLARAVIPPYRDFGLPLTETTLPEALSKLGYEHRAIFGKWHLGHRRAKWHPLNRGFSHFHGHYNGAIDYFELTRENERDWHDGFAASSEQGYATDLIADAAQKWITEVSQYEAPYFCYIPFNSPHSPFQAPEAAIEKFSSLTVPNPKAVNKQKTKQTYAAMIWKMDQGIGKILEAVEKSGEAQETLVIFLSDNGGVGSIPENNAPLRGSKLSAFEGGIRVVAAACWPGNIPAGSRSETLGGYIDLFPTIVFAAGGNPQVLSDNHLDGINLLPYWTAPTQRSEPSRAWYTYHGQSGLQNEHMSVIADGWKLIVRGPRIKEDSAPRKKHQVELFHLTEDPYEKTDLKQQEPKRVQKLWLMLAEHRALQPEDGVPPYGLGNQGFVPPKNWQLDPAQPNQLIGKSPLDSQ